MTHSAEPWSRLAGMLVVRGLCTLRVAEERVLTTSLCLRSGRSASGRQISSPTDSGAFSEPEEERWKGQGQRGGEQGADGQGFGGLIAATGQGGRASSGTRSPLPPGCRFFAIGTVGSHRHEGDLPGEFVRCFFSCCCFFFLKNILIKIPVWHWASAVRILLFQG